MKMKIPVGYNAEKPEGNTLGLEIHTFMDTK